MCMYVYAYVRTYICAHVHDTYTFICASLWAILCVRTYILLYARTYFY